MTRYLPFVIISLVLYTLFFYHNQEPELLSVNNDVSNQKMLLLDFKEIAKLDQESVLKEQSIKQRIVAPTETVPEVATPSEMTAALEIITAPEVTPETAIPSEMTTALEIITVSEATPETAIPSEMTTAPETVTVSEATPETGSTSEMTTASEIKTASDITTASKTRSTSEKPTAPETVAAAKIITPSATESKRETMAAVAAEANILIDKTPQISSNNQRDLASSKQDISFKKVEKAQYFQTSIKSTLASDAAIIKGDYYDQNLFQDFPPPPGYKKIETSKIKATSKTAKPVNASNEPKAKPKQTASLGTKLLTNSNNKPAQQAPSSTIITKSEKPKRIFKKSVKLQQKATLPGLQVAIAVSGNKPTYPQQAKAQKVQGTVTAKFIVNMQGKSKNPTITASSGHKVLDSALLEFIANERFMPALKGIEKVTSEQQLSFEYLY